MVKPGEPAGEQTQNAEKMDIDIPITKKEERIENGERKQTIEGKEDDSEHEPGMRVGHDYQAVIPEMVEDPDTALKEDTVPEPLQVWAPQPQVFDQKLDEYLQVAKDKYGYNSEQALGMLFWHKYNVEKSLEDLPNFTPLPDEWSMEDKVIFEQSFNTYGKHFTKIRAQLPDKSVGTLVKFYYSWKKTRNRTSLMDRQIRRLSSQRDFVSHHATLSDNESEPTGEDTSDSDFEPTKEGKQGNGKPKDSSTTPNAPPLSQKDEQPKPLSSMPSDIKPGTAPCSNCGVVTSQMHSSPKGQLCVPCYHYWRRTGLLRRKDDGGFEGHVQMFRGPQGKLKKKPPKGMQISKDVLQDISQMHGDTHTMPLEMDLMNLRRQVQSNRLTILKEKQALSGRMNALRPPDLGQKVNARWTNEELLMAVQCVRKYGKDFVAMAEVLGNKSVTQCRNFFVNYRRRFDLLDVLEEYEKEHNIKHTDRSHDQWDDLANPLPTSENDSPSAFVSVSSSAPPVPGPISQGLPSHPPPPALYRPTGPPISHPLITMQPQMSRLPQPGGNPLHGPPAPPPPLIKPTPISRPSF